MKGLEGMSCGERLSALGLSHLESRRLRGGLPVLCSSLRREAQRQVLVSKDRTRECDKAALGEVQTGH